MTGHEPRLAPFDVSLGRDCGGSATPRTSTPHRVVMPERMPTARAGIRLLLETNGPPLSGVEVGTTMTRRADLVRFATVYGRPSLISDERPAVSDRQLP